MIGRRRPRLPSLAAIYDAGAEATPGTPNPYAGSTATGDAIREALWRDGREDAEIDRDIMELV